MTVRELAERATVETNRAGRWLPLGAGVLSVLLFLLVKDSLTDDGYITLAYAKNLAVHGEWGLIPGSPANSATSPLNILLLGFLTLLTRVAGDPHPILALGALNLLASTALGWGWMRLCRALRVPAAAAALGILLVLVNPFVLSAIGLEVLLIPAALLLLVVFAVEGRPLAYGMVAGLAVLIRLDLILFVLLIAFSAAAIRRGLLRAVLGAVVIAGPWYVFSWFAFGSAVPDTLVIKQLQEGLFGQWGYFTGPVMYFMTRNLVILLAFAPAVLGLAVLLGWLGLRFAARWENFPPIGPLAALGGGGVVYYVVYSLMGVGPYHWYYVAPMTALGMFAAGAIGVWLARASENPNLRDRTAALALGLVGLLVLGNASVVVKQGVPWKSPVIFGNWASAPDYARVGTELGRRLNGATVSSPGEIGSLAYFCECSIVDEFSDRGAVVDKVQRRIDQAGPVMNLALRANYFWFDWSRKPKVPDYRLRYALGPATGPDQWQVSSAAKGVGHFTLEPAR